MYWYPNFVAVVFKTQEISQQVVTRMQDLASEFWKISKILTTGGATPSRTIEVLHCGNKYRISQFFAAVTDDLHTRGDLSCISSEDVPAWTKNELKWTWPLTETLVPLNFSVVVAPLIRPHTSTEDHSLDPTGWLSSSYP